MELAVGSIVTGKVTTITKFGAFVALPDGKSGLVHISEIANTFVNDVHDYVQDGQTVKVKIIGIGDDGKINLSIKKADEHAPQQRQDQRPPRPASAAQPRQYGGPRQAVPRANGPTGDVSFEDKLKQFMSVSDSKQSELNRYMASKRGGRRRK